MFTAGYIHLLLNMFQGVPTSFSIPLPFFGGTWPRSAKRHLFLTARCLCMQCLPHSLGVSTSFCSINLLVGGLEHFLFSHILGILSSQLTFIFFRGVGQPPTRFKYVVFNKPGCTPFDYSENISSLH